MKENIFLSVCIGVYPWFTFFLIRVPCLYDSKAEEAIDER